jgi:hypothetical protein
MTEPEWLACRHLPSLLAAFRGRMSQRKQWLFACACCRFVWHLLPETHQEVVDQLEAFADGLLTEQGLLTRFDAAQLTVRNGGEAGSEQAMMAVAFHLAGRWGWRRVLGSPRELSAEERQYETDTALYLIARSCAEALAKTEPWEDARAFQIALLHDLLGNPFRPVGFGAALLGWSEWNDGCASNMARRIYDNDDFDVLPILADALEDAGCDNADILNHCRGPGPHVRGCWVVDLLLGKQ